MAPKRSRESSVKGEWDTKRTKLSSSFDDEQPVFQHSTPLSRSETPVEMSTKKVEYTVIYPDSTGKKKLGKDKGVLAELQESPFKAKGAKVEGELDQRYAVLPAKQWADMKKYNNFIIQGEVYRNDTIVYVRSETTKETDGSNDHKFWVAKILQVRAENAQNVYALVAWLYWPEELPGNLKFRREPGAQEYHGQFELVASNYMEVLDVLSFAGKADVSQYLEEDDRISSKLYWRQTFCRQTQELSKLRERCICHGYFNPDPDKQMFICDNSDCDIWLHKKCLLDSALMATYDRLIGATLKNGTQAKKKGSKKPYSGKFAAKLLENNMNTPKVMIEITDLRFGKNRAQWTEEASCLKCDSTLHR